MRHDHPPIFGFIPYTPERTEAIRAARLKVFEEPPPRPKASKTTKPVASKRQPKLPPGLEHLDEATRQMVLNALKKQGL